MPNKSKVIIFTIIIVAIVFVSYILTDSFSQKILLNDNLEFISIVDDENAFGLYMFSLDKKINTLKIISVDPEMVVLKKEEKALAISEFFKRDLNSGYQQACQKCLENIFDMTNYQFTPDNFLNIHLKDLSNIFYLKKTTKQISQNIKNEHRDIQCLNEAVLFENIIKDLRKNVLINTIKFSKNKAYTNISKKSYFYLLAYLKFWKPKIIICNLPVKYTLTRVVPDKESIQSFFENVIKTKEETNEKNEFIIEVQNASNKERMAEKTSKILRQKNLDVIDWKNSKNKFSITIIKDYKGKIKQTQKIVDAMGTGKIIVSYNGKSYYDATVFVGNDFETYDNFDKKHGRK